MHNFRGFPFVAGAVWAIIQLPHQLDFSDMTEDEVHELLDSHDEELSNEQLQQMTNNPHASNDNDNDTEGTSTSQASLTTRMIQDIIWVADDLSTIVSDSDPLQVQKKHDYLLPYKDVLKN